MKHHLPTAEEKHWMAHYWEAAHRRTNPQTGGNLPPGEADLMDRISELETEAEKRRIAGKRYQFLLDEMEWRKKQLERVRGEQ